MKVYEDYLLIVSGGRVFAGFMNLAEIAAVPPSPSIAAQMCANLDRELIVTKITKTR